MPDYPLLDTTMTTTTANVTPATTNNVTTTTTPTPTSSATPATTSSSAGNMKYHLQNLLDSKEKQLQQAATLGQRVLAQRVELEERIRQLQEMDADKTDEEEIDSEGRERYRELAETIEGWDEENAVLSGAFGIGKERFVNGIQPSPTVPFVDTVLREETDRSKPSAGPSAAQSRRAKNAAHRADDVEFAFEIGSGLLVEVRRLQSLLAERDKAIQDMKEEKDDLDKSVEDLRTALRQQEQNADKFKEENWNLEVTLQELRSQLSDSQGDTQRLEGEHKRLTKLLATSRDSGDQHKNEAERLKNTLEEMKAKHETDIAHARKHAASLQRDKSDLQQSVDALKSEASRSKRLPRFGSPSTPNGPTSDFRTPAADDDDPFSVPPSTTNRKRIDGLFPVDAFGDLVDASPDPSPSRPFVASNHPNNEIEALQQRLSHAQRQINTLKGTLQREKESRIGYRRKLDVKSGLEREEENEDDQDDIGYEDVDEEPTSKQHSTPFRPASKGRAKGRKGLTLAQRMAMAPDSPDDEEVLPVDADSSSPPVVPIPIKFHQAEDQEEGDQVQEDSMERVARSPPPSPSPMSSSISNRTSVDGMDPAFANVLHRTPSIGSSPYSSSPLRQSVLSGASRGGGTIGRRRGAAYQQEARPASVVAQPEALAAELGLGMTMGSSSIQNALLDESVEEMDTQEFGCQTEFEEIAPVVVPAVATAAAPPLQDKLVVEMGVQAEPEPESTKEEAPAVIACEGAVQTEVECSEMAVQHDYIEERPVLVSSGTNTEKEVVVPSPVMAQAEIQTVVLDTTDVDTQTADIPLAVKKADADVQTMVSFPDTDVLPSMVADEDPRRRSRILSMDTVRGFPISHYDMSALPSGTPVRTFLVEGEEDGEVGVETETDMEEYHDAQQSIRIATPSESVDDFVSMRTMTDNDFPDSDDESIKASRVSQSAVSLTQRRPSSYYAPKPVVSYESKEVSAKAVLKEICIQTDELTPPTPVVLAPTPGFGLYRVGASQQFQFISPPSSSSPTSTAVSINVPPPSSVIRDSSATFGVRPNSSHADSRKSIESAISSVFDENPSRPRVPSGTVSIGASSNSLSVVDKSKPPMMILPPPPRLPPPPTSMPPPNFIPDRKNKPPPRPSSPPPPDLIHRATTPIGSILSTSTGKGVQGRQHGSSMPPSQQGIRQLPSTSSFKSAAHAATYASTSVHSHSTLPATYSGGDSRRRGLSSTSLVSDRSSISSEHQLYQNQSQSRNRRDTQPDSPVTPNKAADTTVRSNASTDPAIIHAITQTMIGEFLYKYTRRTIGKGHGERRHKRFFWVHPYTKTLYWSSADPGSSHVSESSAKSAYIDGVRSVLDPNPMPPGLHQYSVVVSTPQREMKFTAPTKERHDIWLSALQYLLSRPNTLPTTSPGIVGKVPESPSSAQGGFGDDSRRPRLESSPRSQRSVGSTRNGTSWNTTPRGQRSHSQLSVGGSMGKRSGTAAAEYLRWNGPESPYSPSKSFEHIMPHNEDDLDFELHVDSKSDEGFEGLENVRACCEGRHTVGHHHLRHPLDHAHNGDGAPEQGRPVSPSAWSFSSHSHEGGIFSWGRRDDGKARFGSRRSTTKPVQTS